jgi:hypothetical protein
MDDCISPHPKVIKTLQNDDMCIFQKITMYPHWEQRYMKPRLLYTYEIKSTGENGIKKISNQLTICPHLPMTRI